MNILYFIKPKAELAFVYDDYTVRQTLEKMEHHKYAAIPILNKQGQYIGTIREGDILWHIKNEMNFDIRLAETTYIRDVKKKSTNEPVKISSSMDDLFIKAINQNFVPVVDDDNNFIGIITRKDIVQYYFKQYKKYEKEEKC